MDFSLRPKDLSLHPQEGARPSALPGGAAAPAPYLRLGHFVRRQEDDHLGRAFVQAADVVPHHGLHRLQDDDAVRIGELQGTELSAPHGHPLLLRVPPQHLHQRLQPRSPPPPPPEPRSPPGTAEPTPPAPRDPPCRAAAGTRRRSAGSPPAPTRPGSTGRCRSAPAPAAPCPSWHPSVSWRALSETGKLQSFGFHRTSPGHREQQQKSCSPGGFLPSSREPPIWHPTAELSFTRFFASHPVSKTLYWAVRTRAGIYHPGGFRTRLSSAGAARVHRAPWADPMRTPWRL